VQFGTQFIRSYKVDIIPVSGTLGVYPTYHINIEVSYRLGKREDRVYIGIILRAQQPFFLSGDMKENQ
jgi:hypothetical protein